MKKIILLLILAITLSILVGWDVEPPPPRPTPPFPPISPVDNTNYIFLPLVSR